MCQDLTTADWIQIGIAIITLIGIGVSLFIALATLKQNRKIFLESNRANIMFYVDYHPQTMRYFLVIKNFGNSIGKLLNIEITPKLDWKKSDVPQKMKPLTESTNVLLAPNQKISSWFPFKNYPDKIFDVKISYKTLNKIYIENYKIDLTFLDNSDWIHNYAFDDDSDDYKKVLYRINNSILEVSDSLK